MAGELEENPAQDLIGTYLSPPFNLCQVAGPRALCECVWGRGAPISEAAAAVRILEEGIPHPEQASPLTWAPSGQDHSSDSAQCLADRPPQAGSGGTAVHSCRQRCQVGRAGGTESHSSLAHRTHSCLCLQSTAHSACSGHSWKEKEFMGSTAGRMDGVPTKAFRNTGGHPGPS